ncbi:MAG: hypothetical protein P1P90_00905 [Patescibacteria group bacterium]|nr:hypothetical protein [Patescibacteria group bacterium]
MKATKAVLWLSMMLGFALSLFWVFHHLGNLSPKNTITVITVTICGFLLMWVVKQDSIKMFHFKSNGLFWIPSPENQQSVDYTPIYLNLVFDIAFVSCFSVRLIIFDQNIPNASLIAPWLLGRFIASLASGFVIGRWIHYFHSRRQPS